MAYKEIYTKPDGGIPDSDIASASAWNNKVPSTRKVNGKALSSDIALTSSDVGALPTSGGSLTGNLTVGSSSIGTNGYITGTWLQTTAAGYKAGDFATIDGSGWIYKRKPANVLSDIGGQAKITANGILKGDGTGNITVADETEVELVDLPQQVFWATYGETTNAELEEAYNANKLIMLWHDNKVYYLASKMSNFLYQFFAFAPNSYWKAFYIICYNNRWQATSMTGSLFDRLSSLSLPTASWTGSDPYTQTVTLSDSAADTKVDIQPSEELYDQLVADSVGYLAIKNVDGTLTAVAKGGKPSVDLTVQVTYNSVH